MPPKRSTHSQSSIDGPEIVDPRWILRALAAVLAVGVVCAYLAICALFYYGQWQLVLHPSRTVAQDPRSIGLPFEEVHFSPDAAGQAQLEGWWIPGDTPGDTTVLLLHGGDGSLSDTLPSARILHDARLSVFVFDYRGFGRSAGKHPTEQTMQSDAEAALDWLTGIRHVVPSQLVIFGDHLGASLAVRLCAEHKALAGLILQQGDGDFASRAAADPRSRMVPFRMLFHEDFPLADPLHTLTTPKLLISYTAASYPVDVQRAADPKMTYEIPQAADTADIHAAVRRFLDTYLTQPPPELLRPH